VRVFAGNLPYKRAGLRRYVSRSGSSIGSCRRLLPDARHPGTIVNPSEMATLDGRDFQAPCEDSCLVLRQHLPIDQIVNHEGAFDGTDITVKRKSDCPAGASASSIATSFNPAEFAEKPEERRNIPASSFYDQHAKLFAVRCAV
jgi:hypothetical protein